MKVHMWNSKWDKKHFVIHVFIVENYQILNMYFCIYVQLKRISFNKLDDN